MLKLRLYVCDHCHGVVGAMEWTVREPELNHWQHIGCGGLIKVYDVEPLNGGVK